MKRNKEISRGMRSGQSPYARYGKRPFRYSPAYYTWREGVTGRVLRENAREAEGREDRRNG